MLCGTMELEYFVGTKRCKVCGATTTARDGICSVLCRRRARAKQSTEAGDERITRHASDLAAQGFKCIPLGLSTFPIPEVIAVKDDRVVAVRVVTRKPTEAQVDRYESLPFDDVQWIVNRRPKAGKRKQVVSLGRQPMMRELTCDNDKCGKKFSRPWRQKVREHTFCKRSCCSSWIGRTYGFGRRA